MTILCLMRRKHLKLAEAFDLALRFSLFLSPEDITFRGISYMLIGKIYLQLKSTRK